VAWKATDEDQADAEATLIRAFMARYGALPFANLNAGRRPSVPPVPVVDRSTDQEEGILSDGPRPSTNARTFVVAGRSITISPDDVRRALRGVSPEPVQVWAVQVDGRSYPVVQALEAATGVPRSAIRSARARDVLTALGFRLIRV